MIMMEPRQWQLDLCQSPPPRSSVRQLARTTSRSTRSLTGDRLQSLDVPKYSLCYQLTRSLTLCFRLSLGAEQASYSAQSHHQDPCHGLSTLCSREVSRNQRCSLSLGAVSVYLFQTERFRVTSHENKGANYFGNWNQESTVDIYIRSKRQVVCQIWNRIMILPESITDNREVRADLNHPD